MEERFVRGPLKCLSLEGGQALKEHHRRGTLPKAGVRVSKLKAEDSLSTVGTQEEQKSLRLNALTACKLSRDVLTMILSRIAAPFLYGEEWQKGTQYHFCIYLQPAGSGILGSLMRCVILEAMWLTLQSD